MDSEIAHWITSALGGGGLLMGGGAAFYVRAKIAELAASKADLQNLYKALNSLHEVIDKSIDNTKSELKKEIASEFSSFELAFTKELNGRFVSTKVLEPELKRREERYYEIRKDLDALNVQLNALILRIDGKS